MRKVLFVLTCLYLPSAWAGSAHDELYQRLRGPKAGAHQGGLFAYWPNTLENFEWARQLGADVIEMDLRTTKDGIPVVFHDEYLSLWTRCYDKVSDKTFAEIRECEFYNAKDPHIPSFEEVLLWANGRVVINAEFKDDASIAPAIALVQKYSAHAWTYFQTQNNREKYNLAHHLDPNISLLYAIENTEEDLAWALVQDDSLLVVEINQKTRSRETIAAIHKAGKLVSEDAWHMGKPLEIFSAACKKMFMLGIDIPISNRPRGCVRQRNEFHSKLH